MKLFSKNSKRVITIHQRYRRTDRQTTYHGNTALRYASRGKHNLLRGRFLISCKLENSMHTKSTGRLAQLWAEAWGRLNPERWTHATSCAMEVVPLRSEVCLQSVAVQLSLTQGELSAAEAEALWLTLTGIQQQRQANDRQRQLHHYQPFTAFIPHAP